MALLGSARTLTKVLVLWVNLSFNPLQLLSDINRKSITIVMLQHEWLWWHQILMHWRCSQVHILFGVLTFRRRLGRSVGQILQASRLAGWFSYQPIKLLLTFLAHLGRSMAIYMIVYCILWFYIDFLCSKWEHVKRASSWHWNSKWCSVSKELRWAM